MTDIGILEVIENRSVAKRKKTQSENYAVYQQRHVATSERSIDAETTFNKTSTGLGI